MDPKLIAEAASLLVAARQRHSRIDRLPEAVRPQSIAEAHAVQDAVTAGLGQTVGAFKANAPMPPRTSEGVRAPIYAPAVFPSPAHIPAAAMPQLGVEGEVAFRFRQDLPPRDAPYSREEVSAAMDACAAIEVVSSRFADPAAATTLEKLADGVSNAGFVFGAILPDWRQLDLAQIQVALTVNGETVVAQAGGHPLADPVAVAVALVEMMRPFGGVTAGQFVTCGSYTGLRYLNPGDRCAVRFEGLGEAEVAFDR
ncbi:MAG TPA: fumarylacetoacetate hydrolase family protein [Roseomonas sp.]|jgi:2-keto-4-pentenoate hydratase